MKRVFTIIIVAVLLVSALGVNVATNWSAEVADITYQRELEQGEYLVTKRL